MTDSAALLDALYEAMTWDDDRLWANLDAILDVRAVWDAA